MFEINPDFILQEGDQGLIISGQLFKVVPRTRRFSWLCRIYTPRSNPPSQRQYLRLSPAQINQLILLGVAQELVLKDRYMINHDIPHFDEGCEGRYLHHPIIGINYETQKVQCCFSLVGRKLSPTEIPDQRGGSMFGSLDYFIFMYHLERGDLD